MEIDEIENESLCPSMFETTTNEAFSSLYKSMSTLNLFTKKHLKNHD
jgi:hypothetical protein